MARKSKFSDNQIVTAVKEVEAGASAKEVARKMGVSYETLNRWRQKFSGMTASDVQEKRRLEDENAKLKKLVAQFALEIDSLKVALGKKWWADPATGLHRGGSSEGELLPEDFSYLEHGKSLSPCRLVGGQGRSPRPRHPLSSPAIAMARNG